MTTPYTHEKGIQTHYGGPSAEELRNAARGPEHWTPREYQTDPDYSSVPEKTLEYLAKQVLE